MPIEQADLRNKAIKMPTIEPFEKHADRYEAWFEKHPMAYRSELAAVRALWPEEVEGMEIGVGAGHFAEPLGIGRGVEPSPVMCRRARDRGITVLEGVAERLPLADACCDAALMVTTICFVDDPLQSLRELFRILRPGGCAVIGFVDRESALGREYERKRAESVFYADAHFFSVPEVTALLSQAGFERFEYRQTLFEHPDILTAEEAPVEGTGRGSFVAICGHKKGGAAC